MGWIAASGDVASLQIRAAFIESIGLLSDQESLAMNAKGEGFNQVNWAGEWEGFAGLSAGHTPPHPAAD